VADVFLFCQSHTGFLRKVPSGAVKLALETAESGLLNFSIE
jgi:hypothetical protein